MKVKSKNKCMAYLKKGAFLFFLLLLYIFVSAYSYANTVSQHISESVFRLHVIANSDTQEDQNLKYQVRDALIAYMNELAENIENKQEVMRLSYEHEEDFARIAQSVVEENGYSYPVRIQIGNFSFPTKHYGDLSLPAGDYDALRVEIGTASGQNWWCVMFPPLCFVDVTSGIVPEDSKEIVKEQLSEEEYSVISDSHAQEFEVKFKLLEFFQNHPIFSAKNS